MMKFTMSASAMLALAVAAPMSAQCDFGSATHALPAKIMSDTSGPIGLQYDENVPTWVAHLENRPNEIWGSSLRTNKMPATLKAKDSEHEMYLLLRGRNPFIIGERDIKNQGDTGRYWGLNWYGDFVPVTLKAGVTTGKIYWGQDMMCLVEGSDVWVFAYWAEKWEKLTTASATPTVTVMRGGIIVQDGSSLYGFSMATLGKFPPARFNAPFNIIPGAIAGFGEGDTRRNAYAFTVGFGTTIAIYSCFTHQWHTHTFDKNLPSFDYDKNVIFMPDPAANQLHVFSCHSGQITSRKFSNVGGLNFDGDTAQDNGVGVYDPGAGETVYWRGIDAGFEVLKIGVNTILDYDGRANDLWMQVIPGLKQGDQQAYGISGLARGSKFSSAGIASGEKILKDPTAKTGTTKWDVNDSCGLIATDKYLYGFSAFSGKWTKTAYVGDITFDSEGKALQKFDAEDFFGYVETTTHIYGFNPRTDTWLGYKKSATFKKIVGANEDQMVVVDEDTSASVFSMESLQWKTQTFTGSRLAVDYSGMNSCFYFVTDRPAGGSTVYFWQGYADRWMTKDVSNRITDKAMIRTLEDGLIIIDDKNLHVFSGFSDLSSDYGAPNDNNAYVAIAGASPKFVANGTPNAAALLLLGFARKEQAVPGFRCDLQIDPNFMFILPMGKYAADGTLRFQVTLAAVGGFPGIYRAQMVSDDGKTTPQIGRLLNFQIF